ncbi:hypothetical protein PLICRDRAFT_265447 [Plicaturopsis crispa FD-325 SS-3]|nr:hypothetical protein PLICRDRAFT_265447 [Plicaturopsis crispa FD-325 SS-3]
MASPSSIPPDFTVDNTLGAAFIGFGFSCLFLGISSAQVYRYFRRFPSDRLVYKLLVVLVWVLELVDQALIADAVYYDLVTNFANPQALVAKPVRWSLILQVAIGHFGGTIVKCAFALRVWRFSGHNIPITFTILLMVFSALCFVLVYTVQGFALAYQGVVADATASLKIWSTISLSLGASTDVFTAIALCWYLRKLRTGFKRTDSLARRLTLFSINTGAMTSTVSIATLIAYRCMPGNFVFMGIYFVLSKLYAISFLATLNTRQQIRGRGTDNEDSPSYDNDFLHLGASKNCIPTQAAQKSIGTIEIGINQEVSVMSNINLPDYRL